eukprot:RCo017854
MNWFLRGGGGDAQELLEDHQKALKKLDDMDKVVVQQELNMKQLQLELQALRKYQLASQDEDKFCGKLKLRFEELERSTEALTAEKTALETELATLKSDIQDVQRRIEQEWSARLAQATEATSTENAALAAQVQVLQATIGSLQEQLREPQATSHEVASGAHDSVGCRGGRGAAMARQIEGGVPCTTPEKGMTAPARASADGEQGVAPPPIEAAPVVAAQPQGRRPKGFVRGILRPTTF